MIHKNELLNDECENIAVRIRTVNVHNIWPNMTEATLLFSSKKKYYSVDAVDSLNLTSYHDFHKAIKPKYG